MLKRWLINQDDYGQNVGLQLNGDEKYRSVYGGILPLIGKSFLSIYLINSILKLFDYENNYSMQMWANDVISFPQQVELSGKNF